MLRPGNQEHMLCLFIGVNLRKSIQSQITFSLRIQDHLAPGLLRSASKCDCGISKEPHKGREHVMKVLFKPSESCRCESTLKNFIYLCMGEILHPHEVKQGSLVYEKMPQRKRQKTRQQIFRIC